MGEGGGWVHAVAEHNGGTVRPGDSAVTFAYMYVRPTLYRKTKHVNTNAHVGLMIGPMLVV